ncbi:MAG: sugar phosphate isomerase/epimerase [Pirellulaceae bacterium]
MYKNLSPDAIGIFGRQGEMLEIALTHRFKGLEIDLNEVVKRSKATSVAQACKYLASAKVKIGGEVPIRWAGDEAEFKADLGQLGTFLEVANALSADRCFTTIRPTCDQRPFHENFQFHIDRLRTVADVLAPAGLKLGLSFLAAPADRADGGFEFIHQADPMLQLIHNIQKENVGLMLDSWSWIVGGGDVEKLRALRGDQLVNVRLSDIPAEVELAAIEPQQRILPGSETGTIDSVAILGLLDELGYDGPVAVAQHASHTKGQKREGIVATASALLDTLLAGAGIVAEGALAEAK